MIVNPVSFLYNRIYQMVNIGDKIVALKKKYDKIIPNL